MMSGMETDVTVPARQKNPQNFHPEKNTTGNTHCKVLSENNMCL